MTFHRSAFAVRLRALRTRADVNYALLSPEVDRRLAFPRYKLVSIGELEELLQYGCSQRATEEPIGVPILRMTNLRDGAWDLSDLKYVELTPDQLDTWRLAPGDIVLNRTNSKELVGKCEVFAEPGVWVFASYLLRLRVNTSRARPQFVSDFLGTRIGRLQIDRVSRQIIGMTNINAEEIRLLRLPLPPVEVQDELIARMNQAREGRREQLVAADAMLAGLTEFVFARLGLTLPGPDKGMIWAARVSDTTQRLDPTYHSPQFRSLRNQLDRGKFPSISVADFSPRLVSGFAAGRGDQEDQESEGAVPHIRPLNLTRTGEITLEGTKYVPADALGPDDALRPGELLFNNTNSTLWVGKSAVFDLQRTCACSNHITRLQIDRGLVLSEYVAAVFNALREVGYFGLLSTNFNNQAGINVETLRRVRIPRPPEDVQREIVREVLLRRDQARLTRLAAQHLWQEAKDELEAALLSLANPVA
jgi:type I restriction enzyme S subunit